MTPNSNQDILKKKEAKILMVGLPSHSDLPIYIMVIAARNVVKYVAQWADGTVLNN